MAEGQTSGTIKRPEIAGDRRRLRRTEGSELKMLGQLGTQAHEIIGLATTAERDEAFRSFRNYNEFRRKVSEFEAFCNIIENHLKDVVGDRREELEERFYRLWSMIFHPTIKALTAFFGRLAADDVLPLGCRDILEAEMRALDAMRAALLAPRFAHAADQKIVTEIGDLQTLLRELTAKSTSLPDLSAHVADDEDVDGPAVPAGAPSTAGRAEPASALNVGNVPNVRAVRDLRTQLDLYRSGGSAAYVETDSRALDEIERRLLANPMDGGAIVWLRQIGNAWIGRLGDDGKDIRRILSNVRSG